MSKIEKNRIQEIKQLHSEIAGYTKITLDKAIRIGELLTAQKAELKHGKFMSWIKDNLPFSDRTARDYMKIFVNREKLKMASVANLTAAYRFLMEGWYIPSPLPPPGKDKPDINCFLKDCIERQITTNAVLKEILENSQYCNEEDLREFFSILNRTIELIKIYKSYFSASDNTRKKDNLILVGDGRLFKD